MGAGLTGELDLNLVNSTGDGIVVVSHPTYYSTSGQEDRNYHPAQRVFEYLLLMESAFQKQFAPFQRKEHFISSSLLKMRASLHYGMVYKVQSKEGTFFCGDSLNYTSRLLGTQTARRRGVAASHIFMSRFYRRDIGNSADPSELIEDRNRYPEPIPVYDLYDQAFSAHQIERVITLYGYTEAEAAILLTETGIQSILPGARLAADDTAMSPTKVTYCVPAGNDTTTIQISLELPKTDTTNNILTHPRLKFTQRGFERTERSLWKQELSAWSTRLRKLSQGKQVRDGK
jgi:hypothetical protein